MAAAGPPTDAPARRAAAFSFEGIRYRLVTSTGEERLVLQGASGLNAAPSTLRRLLGDDAAHRRAPGGSAAGGLTAMADTAMMAIMGPSGAGARLPGLSLLAPPALPCCVYPFCCGSLRCCATRRLDARVSRALSSRTGVVEVAEARRGCREEQPAGHHFGQEVWRGCGGAAAR